MVDVQTFSVVIAAGSVVLGIITWLSQNREMKEIQQTRLFMQLFQHMINKDAQMDNIELLDMEWEDYEDFETKHGSARENIPMGRGPPHISSQARGLTPLVRSR